MVPPPPGLVPRVRRKRGSVLTAAELCRVPAGTHDLLRRARGRTYPRSAGSERNLSRNGRHSRAASVPRLDAPPRRRSDPPLPPARRLRRRRRGQPLAQGAGRAGDARPRPAWRRAARGPGARLPGLRHQEHHARGRRGPRGRRRRRRAGRVSLPLGRHAALRGRARRPGRLAGRDRRGAARRTAAARPRAVHGGRPAARGDRGRARQAPAGRGARRSFASATSPSPTT
jgi:hypothetical protein